MSRFAFSHPMDTWKVEETQFTHHHNFYTSLSTYTSIFFHPRTIPQSFKHVKDVRSDVSHSLVIEIIKMQIQFIRTAPDPGASSGAEIAIQELLSLCKAKSGGRVISEVWNVFSEDERTVLSPFLTSRYQWNVDKPPLSAAFRRSSTYEQWIGEWGEYLASRLPPSKGKVFMACRIAMHHNTRLAQFLLPHLLLRLFMFGDERDKEEIIAEIVEILQIATEDSLNADAESRLSSEIGNKRKVSFTFMQLSACLSRPFLC